VTTRSTTGHDDFLFAGSWFDRYHQRVGRRFPTFKIALNVLISQGGHTIVETGSMRVVDNWRDDGCSTYLFGEFAARYGRHLWTCDLDPAVIDVAKSATLEFASHITYIEGDSISFLSRFAEPIALLYLDSFDCPTDGDASDAQQHNLNELIAASPHLSERAVVLLDDNLLANGGKTKRSKEYLLDLGWFCLFDFAQSVWLRPYPEITLAR